MISSISSLRERLSGSDRIVFGITPVLAILLAIVFIVPFFEDWFFLKIILISGLVAADLAILILIMARDREG